MNFLLCLLVPLVIANAAASSGQNVQDASRPQRRNQRRAKVTTTTAATTTHSVSQTERVIGANFVPPQLIKFELTDAKIPDFIQNAQHQRHQPSKSNQNSRPRQRKSRKGTTTDSSISTEHDASKSGESQEAAASAAKSNDQSSSDTRLLHIAHPMPSATFESQRYAKALPFGLQKAINQAMKSDYNPPYLEAVKYYFKEPVPRTKLTNIASLPIGAKLFSDSRIKQWWQLPPQYKASASTYYGLGGKVASTTLKPNLVPVSTAAPYPNDFVAYPLLRGYPVQYSMNVASDLVNGVSFLYGDRIYAKPYSTTSYQNKYKGQASSITADIKPVVEPNPSGEVDGDNGIFRTTIATPTSIFSTSPVVFPSSTETPKKQQTFFKYYAAQEAIPTNPDTGVPLSSDKTTIQLINKAVHELRKHNPHLHVVPKRIENDELVVHVTPKPDFFSTKYPTTAKPIVSVSESLKDLVTDKNLVYLNKVTELNGQKTGGKDSKHTVAYVTHIELPANLEDLYDHGYAFGYRVRDYNTGTDFGHTQKRMTDGTTHGEYKILMPDGRTQNVKYKADNDGYHADVSYDV